MLRNIDRERYLSYLLNTSNFTRFRQLKPVCLFSVGSTQDYLRNSEPLREGNFVVSEVQTAGRGRESRSWLSDNGGLYMSVLLRPSSTILDRITDIASHSIFETLNLDYHLKECEIKLPNDVICKKKKIAGVLVDSAIKGNETLAYLGIGVDLNNGQDWNEEMLVFATSYFLETGNKIEIDDFIIKLLRRLEKKYESLNLE